MTFWKNLSFWQRFWLVAAVCLLVGLDLLMGGFITLNAVILAWVAIELTFDMLMTVVPLVAGTLTEVSEGFLRTTGLMAGWGDESILLAAWGVSVALWVLLGVLAVWWARLLFKKR